MSTAANIPLPTRSYLDNCHWIKTHLAHLMREHADKWIAVDCGRVLAADGDLGKVTEAARRVCESPDVAYEFIASSALIF